jgi:hypothetical protein
MDERLRYFPPAAGKEPEPEPEPGPPLDGDSEEVDLGQTLSLRQKIDAFLGDIPIGRPGAEGATSQRGFDATPLVEFAENANLHDASAEDIYCLFVEAKTREAEEQLMGAPNASDPPPARTAPDEVRDNNPETDSAAVAQQAQYAALYAAGARGIRKQQQRQQARKSTRIAQLKKERDDALWTSSQLQARCEATDEIVRSLQEEAEHSEATVLTAMEDIQELRSRLAASDRNNAAMVIELDTAQRELRECRAELDSREMELQMETSLAQSLSRENRRLCADHAAAVKACEAAKASEAAMKSRLDEVEHIVPKYLEQQEVRGRTRQLAPGTPTVMAAVPGVDLDDTASTAGVQVTSVRTLAFMHGLGFHRRRAAAAAMAAAATAPVVLDETVEKDLQQKEPLSDTQGGAIVDIDSCESTSGDQLLFGATSVLSTLADPVTTAVEFESNANTSVLGWEEMKHGELHSLSFLDEVDAQRAMDREKKIVWADSAGNSTALATVHPYSLASEFSLHRKVRSRAEKREEKRAKEEARREKRKHRRSISTESDNNTNDGDGGSDGHVDRDGDDAAHKSLTHKSKSKSKSQRRTKAKAKGSRSNTNANPRLHTEGASTSTSLSISDGDADVAHNMYMAPNTSSSGDGEGHTRRPAPHACILTGLSGENVRLAVDVDGQESSYEIGRKTAPVGIGTIHNNR